MQRTIVYDAAKQNILNSNKWNKLTMGLSILISIENFGACPVPTMCKILQSKASSLMNDPI